MVATVNSYLTSLSASDWSRACAELSPTITTKLLAQASSGSQSAPRSCPDVLKLFLGRGPASARKQELPTRILAVRVNQDRGFVLYSSAEAPHNSMPMQRLGSAWKTAAIAGVTL